MKVPYMVVVGREGDGAGTVAVHVRGAGKKQKPKPIPLDQFVEPWLKREEDDARWS